MWVKLNIILQTLYHSHVQNYETLYGKGRGGVTISLLLAGSMYRSTMYEGIPILWYLTFPTLNFVECQTKGTCFRVTESMGLYLTVIMINYNCLANLINFLLFSFQIYDGDTDEGSPLATLCGIDMPNPVSSTIGSGLFFRFKSDASVTRTGFSAFFRVQ